MGRDSIVKTAKDVLSCDLDGEVAILNLRTGDYYGLDDVGASVWRLVHEPRSVAEIIDGITAEYDVDPAQCKKDVIELIQDLAGHSLVEIAERD
jgi:hypothetical protein